MKKLHYVAPESEILDVEIENGFAQSPGASDIYQLQNISAFGINDWEKETF